MLVPPDDGRKRRARASSITITIGEQPQIAQIIGINRRVETLAGWMVDFWTIACNSHDGLGVDFWHVSCSLNLVVRAAANRGLRKRVFACTRTNIDDIAALIAKQFQGCLDSKYSPQNIDVEMLMKGFYRYLSNR